MQLTLQRIQQLGTEAAKTGPDLNVATLDIENPTSIRNAIPVANSSTPTKSASYAEAKRELEKEAQAAIARKRASDPERYANLRTSVTVAVSPKSGGKVTTAYRATVALILTPDGARMSQAAIRLALASAEPAVKSPKDWNKLVPAWAIAQWQELVSIAPSPFNQIRLTRRSTLSSLHNKARALVARDSANGVQLLLPIFISSDRLHIGDLSWQIGEKTGRASVAIQRLLEMTTSKKKPIAPLGRNAEARQRQ